MFRRRLALVFKPAYYNTSFVFLVLIMLFQASNARSTTTNSGDICPPSSCGNIRNISHPFRLNTDPERCGERNHTLYCENSNTVLYLYNGKFYVQAINYNNFTIRLVDAGVVEQRCSIFPRFSLCRWNFSNYYDPFTFSPRTPDFQYINIPVIFLSCNNAASSKYNYVDVRDCNSLHFPNSTKIHWYVVVGALNSSMVMDSCSVERLSMVKPPSHHGDDQSFFNYLNYYREGRIINMSYEEIHSAMGYGFELGWQTIPVFFCRKLCKNDFGCYLNHTTDSVLCNNKTEQYRLPYFDLWFLGGVYIVLPLHVKGLPDAIYSFSLEIIEILPISGLLLVILQGAKMLFGSPFIFAFLVYKWRKRHLSAYDTVEDFLENHNNLAPIRYSYSDIKKMTKGFQDKLGEGGFGSVYRGKLRSGRIAAIKMLGKSKANGQDFISEVATIGRIRHVNVVQLIGFCADGSKRALVYDFMPNSSLDKFILNREGSMPLSEKKLLEISIGIAQGIDYLHRGCDMQILHFDIKPHNILLDESFIPKVSDFGLARLYPTNNSIASLTAARGTIGYMAPELFYKNIGPISYKADVYSFGMLLLEMAGKRNNLKLSASNSSQIYFPFWVHDQVSKENVGEIGDVTDEEMEIVKKMTIIGLWCIQMKPNIRPPMNKVVEMLEGDLESLILPPRPVLYPEESIGNVEAKETSMTHESLEPITSISNVSSTSCTEELE